MRKPFFLFFVIVTACGSAGETTLDQTSSEIVLSTITFAQDWSVTKSNDVQPAKAVALRYDLARLPNCRATKYGLQAWSVVAYVSFDGRAPQSIVLAPTSPYVAQTGIVETQIPVPIASDMAVWFHASDAFGCSEWDSKYGQNFHFAIAKPNAPVIHFDAGYNEWTDGIVHAGEDILVDYDWSRVPCRSTYNGYDAFSITMHYSIDNGAARSSDLFSVVGMKRMPAAARITIPHGAHHLAIWFENNDRSGCHAWDSDYGNNYNYSF
jgi:hypothetical protein